MASFNFETHNINVTSLPGDPSQDGTDATGVTQPTGGVGIRGWLSGIFNLFNGGTAKVNATLTGSIICKETNKITAIATDILTDYTATTNMNSTLMIMTNTTGILSLEVDGVLGYLNGGTSLDVSKWYAFEVPITNTSVYNLQFSAVATMQIKWIGGV